MSRECDELAEVPREAKEYTSRRQSLWDGRWGACQQQLQCLLEVGGVPIILPCNSPVLCDPNVESVCDDLASD